MSGTKAIKKFITAAVIVVAALLCITSYGQYNKAYFFWRGREYLIENKYRDAIRIYNAL
jgi:hypothetical protein